MPSEIINVSIGELWDKYTILLIKKKYIKNKSKLEYVENELMYLSKNMEKYSYIDSILFKQLLDINEQLWKIEDKLRIKESLHEFDSQFIELARSVYFTNDRRAESKKEINIKYGSNINEVKEYVEYHN